MGEKSGTMENMQSESTVQIVSLNGTWEFRNPASSDWMQGTVPGVVHTDLVQAGTIPDCFANDNESRLQWVGQTDWIYRKLFDICVPRGDGWHHVLTFEGLDTRAAVTLNGSHLGDTNNMYRRFEFHVDQHLHDHDNCLQVSFLSAEEYAQEEKNKSAVFFPHMDFAVQSPGVNYVRKAPVQGGWDFGPCFLTMGIWQNVAIKSYRFARILYVTTEQYHQEASVTLRINVIVEARESINARIALSIAGDSKIIETTQLLGTETLSTEIEIRNPDLWWPAGYGDQPLYDLEVRLFAGDELLDSDTVRIGFRNLELVTETDTFGHSFYFRVNGLPVYAKGANWVPVDAFPSRATEERYLYLLQSALDANMNMLRVWGGGIYEQDSFFDFCDENGILIWHDFMFACALYPTHDEFLENVREEVRHQVRRLANRPSMALWCGNNESEMLIDLFMDLQLKERGENKEKYLAHYDRLFVQTIGQVMAEEKPDIAYWPSSPSNGIGEYGDAGDPTRGDVHFWDVWYYGKPIRTYLEARPRFSSEFGLHSYPSMKTQEAFADSRELRINSPAVSFRERSAGGTGVNLILNYVADEYVIPEKYADYVYVTQIMQARGLKCACEHWRRIKPQNMGAIYWQLNDIWPAVSWASIEYNGCWKMLHYYAKKFFGPVLLSMTADEDHLHVWMTSDENAALEGEAVIEIRHISGNVLNTEETSFRLDPLESSEIAKMKLDRYIPDGVSKEEVYIRGLSDVSGGVENYEFLAPIKEYRFEAVDIKREVQASNGRIIIRLEADKPAFFVWLSCGDVAGIFSDNGFVIEPGETRVIEFSPLTALGREKIRKCLEVKAINNI